MTADLLPATRPAATLDELSRVGAWLAMSETGKDDPKVKGAAAALRLYFARELGLSPLAASELAVINGRLVVGAALLRALAGRAGYRVIRAESTPETCTVRLVVDRTGEVLGESTFTMADAERAGLIRDRSAWKTHPARMLWARASSYAIRDWAPEVALGMTLDDEVAEAAPAVDGDLPWDPEPEPVDAVVVDRVEVREPTEAEIAEAREQLEADELERAEAERRRAELEAQRGPDYRPAPEQQPLSPPPEPAPVTDDAADLPAF